MNSSGRARGAESLRGGLNCYPDLTGANGVGNSRKSLAEQDVPSPPAGITGLGVARPETDAPHGVERAGFSRTFCAIGQEVMFHGRVLRELGQVASKDVVFENAVPNLRCRSYARLDQCARACLGPAKT